MTFQWSYKYSIATHIAFGVRIFDVWINDKGGEKPRRKTRETTGVWTGIHQAWSPCGKITISQSSHCCDSAEFQLFQPLSYPTAISNP